MDGIMDDKEKGSRQARTAEKPTLEKGADGSIKGVRKAKKTHQATEKPVKTTQSKQKPAKPKAGKAQKSKRVKPQKNTPRKTRGPKGKKGGPRPNSGGAREGAGRPEFVPTQAEREDVARFAGLGIPQKQIARLVRDGIHVDTLREHFEVELELGKARANVTVGSTLFEKCLSGDTTALIWWTKTQMGWKDTTKVQLTGEDGGPVQLQQTLDVSKLSTGALAEIMAAKDAAEHP